MNDLDAMLLDMEADAAAPVEAPKDKLEQVMSLAENMREKEQEVSDIEAQLATVKGDLARLQTEDLPTLMTEIGLSSVGLVGGGKVEIKPDFFTSVTEENKPQAFKWLEDNGNGGIIKTVVVVEFGRNENEAATAFAKQVQELVPDRFVEKKQAIHAQTLKAFVKEQKAIPGNKFPDELFSYFPFNKAVYVAPPKAKRRKK